MSTSFGPKKLEPTKLNKLFEGFKLTSLAESMANAKVCHEFSNAFRVISNTPEFDQTVNMTMNAIGCEKDSAMTLALFSYVYNFNFREELNKMLLTNYDGSKELTTFIYNLVSGMKKKQELLKSHEYMFTIDINTILDSGATLEEGYTVEYQSFIVAQEINQIFSIVPDGKKITCIIASNFHGTLIKNINQNSNEVFIAPGSFLKVSKLADENGVKKIYFSVIQEPSVFTTLLRKLSPLKSKSSLNLSNSKFTVDDAHNGLIKSLDESLPLTELKYKTIPESIKESTFCDYEGCDNDSEEIRKKKKHDIATELLSKCKETINYIKKRGILTKYNMTDEEAMAIAIFTFDYGTGKTEKNPYFVINKMLGGRNSNLRCNLPFLYHLLHALRKLSPVENDNVTCIEELQN